MRLPANVLSREPGRHPSAGEAGAPILAAKRNRLNPGLIQSLHQALLSGLGVWAEAGGNWSGRDSDVANNRKPIQTNTLPGQSHRFAAKMRHTSAPRMTARSSPLFTVESEDQASGYTPHEETRPKTSIGLHLTSITLLNILDSALPME